MSLAGCAREFNLATQKEESLMYGTDKEISIGDAISLQIEKNFKVSTDVEANQRVQRILDRITPICDRKELVYTIRVLDEDEVNAVSLPGGYIYVFKGLIDRAKTDDQLAGVISHEVGHITAKHSIKRLQASYSYMLLQVLAISSGNSAVAGGLNALYMTAFVAYSQQDELESDRLAVKYTRLAGYDPNAMVEIMKIIRENGRKGPLRPVSYMRTHPYINERVAALNVEISGQMQYQDYLNLTGSK